MTVGPSRLSQIETPWSIIRRAHNGSEEDVRTAREALLESYGGAIRRYLMAVLRDEDATDELFQEFSLKLARGDFESASPDRGHFRSFVKTTIYHLIVDYRRRTNRNKVRALGVSDTVAAPDGVDGDEPFHQLWRQELLDRSWARLAAAEKERKAPYYSALRLLTDEPSQSSEAVAASLSERLGRTFTAENTRQVICRARRMFADYLVDEVSVSLDSCSREEIEQELIDLNLFRYCRNALANKPTRPQGRQSSSAEVPVE